MTLANGTNVLTITNTEVINGGTGNDTITIGGSANATVDTGSGTDTVTAGGGTDKILYSATSDFGDVLLSLSLNASEGLDNIELASAIMVNGSGFIAGIAGSTTVASTDGIVVMTDMIADPTSATDTLNLANTLTGLAANDDRYFVVGDNTNSRIWYWDDTGNGTVEAGELTAVADLTGESQATLASADIAIGA